MPQRDFAQVLRVAHPIDVSKEARLAIIVVLDYVLRNMDKVESWLARHGSVLAVRTQLAAESVNESRQRMKESAWTSVLPPVLPRPRRSP